MHVRSLRARHFRNYRQVDARFSPSLNFFVGANGQGKTNLLEALHLVLHGDSFRAGGREVLMESGHGQSTVEGRIEKNGLDFAVRLEISKDGGSRLLNGRRASLLEVRRTFPCVLFSPESLSAIKEGAEARRHLIDDLLIFHDHRNVDILSGYRRALKTRNRVLRHLAEGSTSRASLLEVLESLNIKFFSLAADLAVARETALRRLEPEFQRAVGELTGQKDVEILVEILASARETRGWSHGDHLAAIRQRALELRPAELSGGISLVGPHKHEINFLYHQKNSRFFASQGQQRTLILAFKMAQIVYHRKAHGFYPVLMLDDVLSELDEVKRQALVAFLLGINTQVFLTTTDVEVTERFSGQEFAVHVIEGGAIRP